MTTNSLFLVPKNGGGKPMAHVQQWTLYYH